MTRGERHLRIPSYPNSSPHHRTSLRRAGRSFSQAAIRLAKEFKGIPTLVDSLPRQKNPKDTHKRVKYQQSRPGQVTVRPPAMSWVSSPRAGLKQAGASSKNAGRGWSAAGSSNAALHHQPPGMPGSVPFSGSARSPFSSNNSGSTTATDHQRALDMDPEAVSHVGAGGCRVCGASSGLRLHLLGTVCVVLGSMAKQPREATYLTSRVSISRMLEFLALSYIRDRSHCIYLF